mgnify:FL=1
MKATVEHPYPNDFEEFLDWFATEDDCRAYLEWVSWPKGFKCPKCGYTEYTRTSVGLCRCKKCTFRCSVKTGTIFEDGHKSLKLWFFVIWLLMAQKTGMSAQNFHDAFGFGSYQTSWAWLQKLRSVMIRPGRELLQGRVEVDGTYVGGRKEGKRGRGAAGKTLVLVAVEGEKGKKLGRVRFRVVESESEEAVKRFIMDFVQEGSVVVTDGLKSYDFVDGLNYIHEQYVISKRADDIASDPESNLEHVHLVVSLVKRWLLGTHQGAVTPHHLEGYLDEYAFRFNRRMSTHRGKLFFRLIEQAVSTKGKGIKDYYKIPNKG